VEPNEVLSYCERHGVKRILFASSGEVTGTRERFKGYRVQKAVTELLLMRGSISHTTARIYTVAGPYLPLDRYAIGKFIQQAVAGGPVVVEEGTGVLRSYLYGADLAVWMWTIAIHGDLPVYQVGSRATISIYQLSKLVAKLAEVDWVQKRGPEVSDVYIPSDMSMVRGLGLSEHYSLTKMIENMLEFYKRENE
jgi:dTDP-glucose 4,6-dehydratase